MGSTVKQSNGRWRARYRDLNGRSRSKTFDRKQDADRFLDDTSTDQRRGEWIDPRTRRDTFDAWADRWWATTVRLRPTTRRGYHGLLERHVRPYFASRRIVEIDYVDVEEFIANRLAAGLSAKYVRQAVSVCSLILETAVKARVRRDNPASGHHVTVRRSKLRSGDVLDMAEAHRLVANVRDPYKPAIWLLILTGIRPAELCGLRVRSVDFSRLTIHITETLLPVHKFADVAYDSAVKGPPKSEAGNRSIPIPGWLCEQLANSLAERAKRRGSPIQLDDPLFTTPKGLPLHRDRFRQSVIRPALAASGLPQTFRTYDLRHAHASLLIEQGANILAVAQRLGHADPAVTLRVYGHLFDGVQERLTQGLDELCQSTIPAAAEASVVPIDGCRQDTSRTQGHRKDTKSRSLPVRTGECQ